jgi:hypothetical protein
MYCDWFCSNRIIFSLLQIPFTMPTNPKITVVRDVVRRAAVRAFDRDIVAPIAGSLCFCSDCHFDFSFPEIHNYCE